MLPYSNLVIGATPTEHEHLQPTIILVECKFTKKKKYYPFEDSRKRKQLDAYLHEAEIYKARGFNVMCFLIVKVNKKVHFIRFRKTEDLPRSIQ